MRRILYIIALINFGWAIGAKYLIITHDNFYDAIKPLAHWKHKKGVPTKIVKLSEIGATPESIARIKRYIVNAYNSWTPRPEYVLLVGSPTYIKAEVGAYDDYYGNMDEQYRMELAVGRFSCENVSQCSLMVTKTLGYERTPYLTDSLWFRKGTTIVREDYDSDDTIYWADVRYVHSCWQSAGYIHIDSFSRAGGNNQIDVENAITDGRAYVVYRGQGTSNWWSPFQVNPNNMNNGFKLPIVVSATCHTMSLSGYVELGENFTRAGTVSNPKGAVGFFGTTQTGSGIAQCRGAVAKGFFKALFEEKNYKLGDVAKRAKFIADSINPNNWSSTRYREWNLLGDPELNLWTAVPKPLTVVYDTVIVTTPQNFTVTVKYQNNPVSGALVCIMQDTLIYQYDTTDASGVVRFSINPTTAGFMSITVTARNFMPYEDSIRIQLGGNFHDVGVLEILAPSEVIASGSSVTPKALLKNFGTFTDTFAVTFKIGTVYTSTISGVILAPGETITKVFTPWYATSGTYQVKAYTQLGSDAWRANDTAYRTVRVLFPIDVGIESIISPISQHPVNSPLTPAVRLKNYGAETAQNFSVVCSIVNLNGILRYSSIQYVSNLLAGRDTLIIFASWTPSIPEACSLKARLNVTGDGDPSNDYQACHFTVTLSQTVIIGTGTTYDYRGPFNRYYNYSTHEAIYKSSEIGTRGRITRLGYYKHQGPNHDSIVNVTIYLKHTQDTILPSDTYSLSGYTQVFSGAFPNDPDTGWMEITLDSPFYSTSQNLQILIIKGYQQWIHQSECPYYRYTNTSPVYLTRQAASDNNQPTSLTQTYNRPNIKLELLQNIYDVGPTEITSPPERIIPNQASEVIAKFKNFGIYSAMFPIHVQITDSFTHELVFSKDSSLTLQPNSVVTVNLGQFVPMANRIYNILVYTSLLNDEDPQSDTIRKITRTTIGSLPDGAGYFYESTQDSIYGDTVRYTWIPATSGIQLTGFVPNADDGNVKVPLPFIFPYYGQGLCSLYVCTNGFLQYPTTFTSQGVANQILPYAPINNFIGGLWDDLDLRTSGKIYYYQDPNSDFVVFSWESVPRYNNPTQRNSFQIILYKDGRIKYQYQFLQGTDVSSTIGIQGGTGANNRYLNYVVNGIPNYHIPTANTAILFNYHRDAYPVSIVAPAGIVDSGTVIIPSVYIYNSCCNPQPIKAQLTIGSSYLDTTEITLNGNSSSLATFRPWTAAEFGNVPVKCTLLYNDDNPYNNKITSNVRVRYHDVGVYQINSPVGIHLSESLEVAATVKNYYTRIASCSVSILIKDTFNQIIYQQTKYLSSILPESTKIIKFGKLAFEPGKYYHTCFTKLATDDNPTNDTMHDSLIVIPHQKPTGWYQKSPLSTLVPGKYVKDGAALVGTNYGIYATRGNRSNEFYLYDGERWWLKETLPFAYKETDSTRLVKKRVGKGGALCYDGANKIYALKGNSTKEFWMYDIAANRWCQKANVPVSKGIKAGSAITFYHGKVYLIAGGVKPGEPNFYAYDTVTNQWILKNPAPMRDNRPYKDGTALTTLRDTIYVLKGGSKNSYFFRYIPETNSWQELESIPSQHPQVRKNTCTKSGGALVSSNNFIYAIKGGGSNEFWVYQPGANRWIPKDTIPRLNKSSVPKGGACLGFYNGAIYLLKGNNTNEFWSYVPNDTTTTNSFVVKFSVFNSTSETLFQNNYLKPDIKIDPILKSHLIKIKYRLPYNCHVIIDCYSINGEKIAVVENTYKLRGHYEHTVKLPSGIYFLRAQLDQSIETRKVVIP
ncbi:MAG: C25 family cysteine peptidase [candidate division WOR-3 bacterium]